MRKVVYFNQWFSSIAGVIDDMKIRNSGNIVVIGSSKNSEHSYKNSVDEFIVEDWEEVPGNLEETKKNYVDWVLKLCDSYRVDFFFVKKHADWIAERASDFIVMGVRLINENIKVFEAMQSKANVYDLISKVEDLKWIVPHYMKTSNKYEIEELLDKVGSDNPWCFKLDSDEGGASFRRIDTSKITIDSLQKFRVNTVSLKEAKNMLVYLEAEELNKLIYMELLDGPEISVDCYDSNQGFIAICREKIEGTRTQRIYYNKEISVICEKLKSLFDIKFPFNVQFRIKHNTNNVDIENYRLLEINPRMSGGTYYSTLFGMNLAHICLSDLLNNDDGYRIVDFISLEDKFVTHVEKAIPVER